MALEHYEQLNNMALEHWHLFIPLYFLFCFFISFVLLGGM